MGLGSDMSQIRVVFVQAQLLRDWERVHQARAFPAVGGARLILSASAPGCTTFATPLLAGWCSLVTNAM